ncbi:M28 family peptidase [Taibaiella lutea]|uniref:M28 family peptidase n=1 Tax=Taibaiella lutea TaxID=2608001 RepID=A0A5M6CNL7_9BACT|nr:M28 family peptidase [Taibaiella lutea]KAA5536734.1 M28 family peptidase [Taibaiella lutea]
MKHLFNGILFAAAIIAGSCSSTNNSAEQTTDTSAESTAPQVKVPLFNADSAYSYTAQQVAFGPRTPGSASQLKCANWMETHLKMYTDTVYRQETTVIAGDNKTKLRCINLIGVINPQAPRRILLLAHWDSRPWADRDIANKNTPIDAADDGASGVAVLIELANRIRQNPLTNKDIGIDILLTDVEDYGKSEWGDNSYALGTQYWARNPHVPGYKAEGGILLDMVGGKNARFLLESISRQFAGNLQRDVWSAATTAGFSSFFVYDEGGQITDDHVPVNEIMHIPTIDIICLPADSPTGFPLHWHTHNDNMSVIDKSTLNAVGQTLLQFIYSR